MPRILTTAIPDSECMGDSLATINTNYDNLDNAVQGLSSQTISITNTDTVDLTYNPVSRNLTASVKLSSITTEFLSPTFGLSSTQIIQETKPGAFKKFKWNLGDKTASTFYNSSFFQSQEGDLYACGYSLGYGFGMGSAGNSSDYMSKGFQKLTISNLLEGEYVVEHYLTGGGATSAYILTNLGNLYSMGYNGYGQLGLGDTTARSIWTRINLSNVIYFDCGNTGGAYVHCFAINSSGELYGWGYNGFGQLGNGNATQQTSPVRINGGDIAGKVIKKCSAVEDAGSYSYSFVIDQDDNVYSAGYNGYGQLGQNNTTTTNVFKQIYSVGSPLKADYILARGWSSQGTSYLIRDNELWSCGYNAYGQLGLGDTTQRNAFTKVNGISVAEMTIYSSNALSVCVRQLDNTLKVWGYNGYGQLGTNNTTQQNSPVTPFGNPQNIVKIKGKGWADSGALWILNSDGEIFGTGYNGHGAFGVNDASQRNQFTKLIKNDNIKFVDMCPFGYSNVNNLIAVTDKGELYGVGYNGNWNTGVLTQYTDSFYVIQKCFVNS